MKKVIAWFMSFVGGASIGVSISVYGAAEQKAIEIDQNRCLLHAADKGYVDMVRTALYLNAQVDIGNAQAGRTPLMFAAEQGHEYVVAALIQGNANVNALSDSYETPLWLAINGGHVNIAELLVDAGADMDKENMYLENGKLCARMSALFQVAENKSNLSLELLHRMTWMLIEKKADVNKQNVFGFQETPLMMAAKNGNSVVMQELLLACADETLKDATGRTMDDYAQGYDREADIRNRIETCFVDRTPMVSFIKDMHKRGAELRVGRVGKRGKLLYVERKMAPSLEEERYMPRKCGKKQERDWRERNVEGIMLEVILSKRGVVTQHKNKKSKALRIARRVVSIACPECTYHNSEQAQACEMCYTPLVVE